MPPLHSAILLCLPLLAACSNPAGLTVHNGLAETVQISGLPGGDLALDAGQSHYIKKIDAALSLRGSSKAGSKTATIPLPPTGGQALWVIGGGVCFVVGDYSSYYQDPLDLPASIHVVELLGKGTETWVSSAAITTAPGQRLPETMRGEQVLAVVQVPCEVTLSTEVAQGWLEMTLDDLQPSQAAEKQ